MEEQIAVFIFKFIWGTLLIIALLAQWFFRGKIKEKAGVVANLLVVMPYVIVFACFSSRDYLGAYKANIILQLLGLAIMFAGAIGYVVSILYLKYNWAVSAEIKEGHRLVNSGPYKFVRHPMYFFMILVVLGSGLLISNFPIILYTPVIAVLYYLRSKKEEELLQRFLPGYDEYRKKTKMLIPGIF